MANFEGYDLRRVETRVSHAASVARADTRRADTKAQILFAVIGVALIAGMPSLLRGGLNRVTTVTGWLAVLFASFTLFALVLVVLPRPGKARVASADALIADAIRDLECSEDYVRERAENAAVIQSLASFKWRLVSMAAQFTLFAGLLGGVSCVCAALGV